MCIVGESRFRGSVHSMKFTDCFCGYDIDNSTWIAEIFPGLLGSNNAFSKIVAPIDMLWLTETWFLLQGKHQRQTLHEQNDYFVCVNYVRVEGILLNPCTCGVSSCGLQFALRCRYVIQASLLHAAWIPKDLKCKPFACSNNVLPHDGISISVNDEHAMEYSTCQDYHVRI